MIRMTRLTDYAIVLLAYCARHPERPLHSTRDLAEEAHLPMPTVGKILKLLARKGLLVSHRGVRGGYVLSRPASQITVAEIIGALEGPIAITECSHDAPGNCDLEKRCPVHLTWQKINQVVWEAVSRISLQDIALPQTERLVTLGSWVPAAAPGVTGTSGIGESEP